MTAELESTIPEDHLARSSSGDVESDATLSLVVVACSGEPERVGTLAFVPAGQARVLGRGPDAPDDPAPRLVFGAWRAGRVSLAAPFASAHLSRIQLRLRGLADAIEIQNVGRLSLKVNGAEVAAPCVRVVPGDVVELGVQLMFFVTRRAVKAALQAPSFAFGTKDENGLLGESSAMESLRERIAFVAARAGHVLVRGPSGSGKELVARALSAGTRGRPFVARNAATIPEGLVDAELFGNAQNYPNAGLPARPGLLGEADGGTLFLDEFAELPESAQVHLLRVLDAGEYQRLGEARTRTSTFRMVAATNRPMHCLRNDVAARFAFCIDVPGLDARREDIPLLARHLVMGFVQSDPLLAQRASRFCDSDGTPRFAMRLVRALVRRSYTTHVRELTGLLWRAVEHSRGAELDLPIDALPERAVDAPHAESTSTEESSLSALEIQRCLDAHNGVLEDTWKALKLANRHVLARLVRKHGIEVRRNVR